MISSVKEIKRVLVYFFINRSIDSKMNIIIYISQIQFKDVISFEFKSFHSIKSVFIDILIFNKEVYEEKENLSGSNSTRTFLFWNTFLYTN